MLAPICLFTYNRLAEARQTVEALQKNYLAPESELFIFSDDAKNESSLPTGITYSTRIILIELSY